MDPNSRRPLELGAGGDDFHGRPRTTRLVAGDFVLTINPIDGSEVERRTPGEKSSAPRRRTPEERAELGGAAVPPTPAGAVPTPPLLDREAERKHIADLLAHGYSIRLVGRPGSGRSMLLEAAAGDCADFAPDGVVRLSGYRRTPTDLLHELFAAVHHAPQLRPARAQLLEAVRKIGAVVVVDDIEFGGAALDELLAATPECAFLISATPEVPMPSAGAHLEEIVLQGLGHTACLQLLEHAVGRPLVEDESRWATDLWFESEGLPLRFIQAAAILRQRNELPAAARSAEAGEGAGGDGNADSDGSLPTLVQSVAPAGMLAARLSGAARDALRIAVALGGELPHHAHLPALVDTTGTDRAMGELVSAGLVTAVDAHYTLAHGVLDQLVAAGYAEGAAERVRTIAQHYTWWAGHPSVTPKRVVSESDALLAALWRVQLGGPPSTAVLLARAAAPAFAAELRWGAWEQVLRSGQEAARMAGEIAEEAYFHHELGVHALCTDNLQRARAELGAAIGLRGAPTDQHGAIVGRRALALVEDTSGRGAFGLGAPAPGAFGAGMPGPGADGDAAGPSHQAWPTLPPTAPTPALSAAPPAFGRGYPHSDLPLPELLNSAPTVEFGAIAGVGEAPGEHGDPGAVAGDRADAGGHADAEDGDRADAGVDGGAGADAVDTAVLAKAGADTEAGRKVSADVGVGADPDSEITLVLGERVPRIPLRRLGERPGWRNAVATGAGALLVAMVGTAAMLGTTRNGGEDPADHGSVSHQDDDPADDDASHSPTGETTAHPARHGKTPTTGQTSESSSGTPESTVDQGPAEYPTPTGVGSLDDSGAGWSGDRDVSTGNGSGPGYSHGTSSSGSSSGWNSGPSGDSSRGSSSGHRGWPSGSAPGGGASGSRTPSNGGTTTGSGGATPTEPDSEPSASHGSGQGASQGGSPDGGGANSGTPGSGASTGSNSHSGTPDGEASQGSWDGDEPHGNGVHKDWSKRRGNGSPSQSAGGWPGERGKGKAA